MRNWTRIAHRGGAAHAPENTLAAFGRALGIGTDVIEIDVRLSKDGEIVVIHDETLDRTTNAAGAVADLTLEEIRRADAGVRFSKEFKGERVPTLTETLECIPAGTLVLVEIKAAAATVPVLETVHEMGRDDQILIVSFDPRVVETAFRHSPHIPRAMSFGEALVEGDSLANARRMHQEALSVGGAVLDVVGYLLTEPAVREVHQRGGCVWVWTLSERKHIQAAIDAGVDGITSDYPDRLNEFE